MDDKGIWDAWVVLSSGNGVKSLMKGEGVPWILHMETGYNYNWMKDVINPGLKPISDAHSWPTSQGASPPVCFGAFQIFQRRPSCLEILNFPRPAMRAPAFVSCIRVDHDSTSLQICSGVPHRISNKTVAAFVCLSLLGLTHPFCDHFGSSNFGSC